MEATLDCLWKIMVTGVGSRGLENPKVTVIIDTRKQKDLGI